MSASFSLKLGAHLLLVFLVLIAIQGTEAGRQSRDYDDDDGDGNTSEESNCDSDLRTTNTSSRIVNGYYALPGQFPFVVRVEIMWENGQKGICTGTIVDSTTVLTAAHCVLANEQRLLIKNPNSIRVIAGDHRRGFNANYVMTYKPKLIAIHGAYKYGKTYSNNDIALIMTRDKIKINNGDSNGYGRIDTVGMPPRGGLVNRPGAKVTVAGWGRTKPGDVNSEAVQLMALDSKVVQCSDSSVPKIVQKEFVCIPFDGMRGMCHGDSGGPLFVPASGRGKAVQYGISNFVPGGKCARAQSYYLDLSNYVSWVKGAKQNINSNLYIVRKNTEP